MRWLVTAIAVYGALAFARISFIDESVLAWLVASALAGIAAANFLPRRD